MEAVKAFTLELYSIMEMKPPISKAKMTAITRNAIKAIKLYKHVVQCVEKFIQKCKPEYKIPGLYVIDSIVRQSRHQFGNDKDVFAPRFARNLKLTFTHLFACPEEDKSKVIRVLNLWQKNAVFTTDVIQPIFDLAANPDYDHTNILPAVDNSPKISIKTDLFKSQENTPVKDDVFKSFDALQSQNSENDKPIDPAILQHIHAIQSLLKKQPGQSSTSPQVKKSDGVKLFDKKILDYDYGDDEEDMLNQSPEFQQQPQQHQNTDIEGLDRNWNLLSQENYDLQSLLSNPEVLRTLRNVEGLMSTQSKQQAEMDKIKEMKKEAEFDKHLAQTVQNLPFASECELKPSSMIPQSAGMMSNPYGNQMFNPQMYQQQQSIMALEPQHKPVPQIPFEDQNQSKPEVIDLDHIASPPQSKRDSRRDGYSTSSSRKRSPRKSSRERQREREKDRERDRERRKKYLPPFKKNHLAVVSTTLWVGHLSKLIHQDDLYGLFQPIGDIVSLNLISPRGCAFLCMNRRQDAARIMNKFQGERLQGKPMTIAWAPGQAMKDKEWKDYWEIDEGVSYIPWEKLNKDIDYDELEVGGMLDEDTMPEWLKTHLKNLRTTKKNEKKEEEKLTEVIQQSTTASVFDTQSVQSSPSVQMQISPAQNSQPNQQMNFNMPQTMSMPNPFGINPRLISPMMNPMMPGTMPPIGMGHPSMMMMNRMPSPFGPPPNMSMMGNPQQMGITNDAQKSLGVPPDMMMSFPFSMNLPSQAPPISSSAQSMIGMNPSTVTSSATSLSHNTNQKDNFSTTNPTNQMDPSTMMQFNLPPPPTLPNLTDFTQSAKNVSVDSEKYDPSLLGNYDHEESKNNDRNNERDRNRGRDDRNRSRNSRERNDRFKDRDSKNDRSRKDDMSQRQDPRNRIKGPEQRERKSSRWGDKVIDEADNKNNIEGVSLKEVMPHVPNLAQIGNVKDILTQNNSLPQILDHLIHDNMGNPPFQQPGMFGPNGPLPNQMFNMPPQGFPQDNSRPSLMDSGNMRGRGGWNRGGRGGFRGRGGFNNGPNWDNNGTNWDNNGINNEWDNNGPPPVWQNQNINRGGMMGRGNLRPPLMQNVMGRGRDNWIDNNVTAGRGGRDSDNWGSRGSGGGRDSDKWGGRGSRGNRLSPWRGNGNRRRNDDFEGSNQKRWRRDDNPEWDEQQKPWKRGSLNEDEEWQQNRQGSLRAPNKNDDGNYSKFKNRDNNEVRPRKPSKWGDRESDGDKESDKVKENSRSEKSAELTSSKDNAEDPHQSSTPMDLDDYESTENSEKLHKTREQVSSNLTNDESRQIQELENEPHKEAVQQEHHDLSNLNTEAFSHGENNSKQNFDLQLNDEHHQFNENYNNEQRSVEEKEKKKYHPHNNCEEKTFQDIHNNSTQECEISQNYREIEQNKLVEPACNYENVPQIYEQSYSDETSNKHHNQQEHCLIDNVAPHVEENNAGKNVEEKLQTNFFFGMDAANCGSSVADLAEIDQPCNETFTDENITMALPADNNEVQEIVSVEPSEN